MIGWIWEPGSSSGYYFLQYALAGSSGPAWFQFNENDTLQVQVWDLSPSSAPHVSAYHVNLTLSALDGSGTAQTYVPSDYLTYASTAAVQQPAPNGTDQYLALVTSAFSYTGAPSPCWGPARGSSGLLGPITFSTAAQYKLSFYVEVVAGLDITKKFISDPETVVGSGSQ